MPQIHRLSQFERQPKIMGHIELKAKSFISAVISKEERLRNLLKPTDLSFLAKTEK